MLIQVIGEVLPIAMAVSISPIPIVAVALVLGTPRGAAAGAAFAVGWVLALTAATWLLLLAAVEAEAVYRTTDAWLLIVIGLALLAAAGWKWRTRPRAGAEPKVPRWMASLNRASPGQAGLFGIALGVNPKNLAFAFAASASIADRALQGIQSALGIAAFVLLGSVTVLGAVAARLLGGERAAKQLEALKQFMLANNNVIVMIILTLIGVTVLGDGLSALGGAG